MPGEGTREVSIAVLRDLMERLFRAVGCDAETARITTDPFLEAHLRGINHHGLDYMLHFLGHFRRDKVDPKGRPRVVREGPAFALVDGGTGPGQVAGAFAADLAARKAAAAGSAVVGVTNSSGFYMVGYFVDRIAEHGQIGIAVSTSLPYGHAHGGIEPVMGTSPLAIAVPTRLGLTILVDMATTAIAMATVREAVYRGEPLAEGNALDRAGVPTTDPEAALSGALSPFGGAKGFGLGLFVGILAGPLVASEVGRGLADWGEDRMGPAGNKGHLFIAIDCGAFVGREAFLDAVEGYADEVRSGRRAPGRDIRIPGERVYQSRRETLETGSIPIECAVWANAARIAGELGVEMPA